MRLVDHEVHLTVPATSANLGAGFDTFGLALGMRDRLSVRTTSAATHATISGEGAASADAGEQNLVVRAMRVAFDHVGVRQPNLALTCRNAIPHARGLGSSAAAAVGGLAAARALLDEPDALSDDDLFRLATQLEGHPDNAAPALFGGATIAWLDDGRPNHRRLPIDEAIAPVVFIPEARSSTAKSRATLPAEVPHGDATFNVQRAALMVLALTDPRLLFRATDDRLHQPYRAAAMPDSMQLVAQLREAGHAAMLSGAGPTVLCLTTVDETDEVTALVPATGWRAVALPVSRGGVRLLSDEQG